MESFRSDVSKKENMFKCIERKFFCSIGEAEDEFREHRFKKSYKLHKSEVKWEYRKPSFPNLEVSIKFEKRKRNMRNICLKNSMNLVINKRKDRILVEIFLGSFCGIIIFLEISSILWDFSFSALLGYFFRDCHTCPDPKRRKWKV